jgi:carbon storage regulator
MLTLTREVGEKILIGDDIVITVVSVSENGRVRLGIEAPRQIRIDRAEVLERIRKENLEAGAEVSDQVAWAVHAAKKANMRAASNDDGARAGS